MVVDDEGEVEFRTTSEEDFDSLMDAETAGGGGDGTVTVAIPANLSGIARLRF